MPSRTLLPESSCPAAPVQLLLPDGSCLTAPAWLSDDELNVLIREESFCDELDESIDALIARARLVERGEDVLSSAEWYSDRRAQWEELWQ